MRIALFRFLFITLSVACSAPVTPLLLLHDSLTEVALYAEYRKIAEAITTFREELTLVDGAGSSAPLIEEIMQIVGREHNLFIQFDKNKTGRRSFSLDGYSQLSSDDRTNVNFDITMCIADIAYKTLSSYTDLKSSSAITTLDIVQWFLTSPAQEREKFVKWACEVMQLYRKHKKAVLKILEEGLGDAETSFNLRQKIVWNNQEGKSLQNVFADLAMLYGEFKDFDDARVAKAIVEIIDPETRDSNGKIVRPLRDEFARVQSDFQPGDLAGIAKNNRYLRWTRAEKDKDLNMLEFLAVMREILSPLE